MDSTTRLSIELPHDLADALRARVASGSYTSESEVVAEGLALLAEQEEPLDEAVEAELAAGYDAWKADPKNVVGLDDASAGLAEESARRQRPA